MHGQGACVEGEHVWWGRACVAGSVHGGGACEAGGNAWQRGACMTRGTCVAGGHAWQRGTCMARGKCMAGGHAWLEGMHGGGGHGGEGRAWQILRDTVNEQGVRILLECILVITSCPA